MSARLTIGYTPLCDCAPVVVAQELGLFAEHGLDVQLARQSSWATSRDLLRIGALDAAHMLAPVPVASGGAIVAPMALSLNGNTIAVSSTLFSQLRDIDTGAGEDALAAARALGVLAKRRAERGARPLLFAAVFAESNHVIDLKRWFAAGNVRLERDVWLSIVPPGEVEPALEQGIIDGFCVGEPWGSLAVARAAGRIVATSYDLWSNRIEKVLGVGARVAEERPTELDAMLQALIRAAQWCDAPENRLALASLLARGGYVDAPIEVLRCALTGAMVYAAGEQARVNPDFMVFHRYAANFPWLSQAQWIAQKLGPGAARAFRPDLYARAAKSLGVAHPLSESKIEGAHDSSWTLSEATAPIPMGRDRMFDASSFDPRVRD